jgi:hypothetical protein
VAFRELFVKSPTEKPFDEPLREWALTTCVHCESHVALERNSCLTCGHRRSWQDQNMADRVLRWRASPQGQESWKRFNEFNDQVKREKDLIHGFMSLIIVAMMFGGGFVIFGFIGLFFDLGLIMALSGGIAMAVVGAKAV